MAKADNAKRDGTLTESIPMTTSNGCHIVATFSDEKRDSDPLQHALDALQHDYAESSIVR